MSILILVALFGVTSMLFPCICFSVVEEPDGNEKNLNDDGLEYRDVNVFYGASGCQGTIRKDIEDAVKNVCTLQNKSEGIFAEQLKTVSLKMEQLEKKIDGNLVQIEALEKKLDEKLYKFVQEIIDKKNSSCLAITKGYVYNETGRFYYKLHTECKTWSEAREACQSEGGDLISLKENNFQFFKELARTKSTTCRPEHVWVGTTDIASPGNWFWLNGEKISSVFWDPGQPDPGSEHCGHLNVYYSYNLNNQGCSEKVNFLCQIYL